jgi:hypothetical protein
VERAGTGEGTATVEVLAADGTVLAAVEPLTARGG